MYLVYTWFNFIGCDGVWSPISGQSEYRTFYLAHWSVILYTVPVRWRSNSVWLPIVQLRFCCSLPGAIFWVVCCVFCSGDGRRVLDYHRAPKRSLHSRKSWYRYVWCLWMNCRVPDTIASNCRLWLLFCFAVPVLFFLFFWLFYFRWSASSARLSSSRRERSSRQTASRIKSPSSSQSVKTSKALKPWLEWTRYDTQDVWYDLRLRQ